MAELRAYQHEAADFIYERDHSLILAKVGAGKTAIALTAMEALTKDGYVDRWLVFAPKKVCQNVWPIEQKLWAKGLTLAVAVGTQEERLAALKSRANVVVINYDNAVWLSETEFKFDGVVFDELTQFKTSGNSRSKKGTKQEKGVRYEAAYRWMEDIPIRIGLTGSFTSNGLEDVFGQVKMVDNKVLGSTKSRFLAEHFILVNKDFGEYMPRPNALNNIMARIKPITYLLESPEYANSLPACHIVEQFCDLDDRAPYEEMKKELVIEMGGEQILAANRGVVVAKLQQLAGGFVYHTTKHPNKQHPGKFITVQTPFVTGNHKLDKLDDIIKENHNENTLVWYWYKEELAMLKRRFPKAVTIDEPNAIERWNKGQISMLLAHPQSAGHGVNLQFGGCAMVFYSMPWSLELFEQAVGRLHRSGQTKDVWVYLLIARKTVDEKIFATLNDKKDLSTLAIESLKNV